jgi:hypothetical protein
VLRRSGFGDSVRAQRKFGPSAHHQLALGGVAGREHRHARPAGCYKEEDEADRQHIRDIFGNPFRPVAFNPAWRTDTVLFLARQMYNAREFSAMPILADASQDAGCDSTDSRGHCRGPGPHMRGCWVVDLVLGKE